MSCDAEDRRTRAILRAQTTSEGRIAALAAEYGIEADVAETPGEAPDDAAIVSDITHDTDDDHSKSQATVDSREWKTVTRKARTMRNSESTGGIIMQHWSYQHTNARRDEGVITSGRQASRTGHRILALSRT
jgi:hypothetical protein